MKRPASPPSSRKPERSAGYPGPIEQRGRVAGFRSGDDARYSRGSGIRHIQNRAAPDDFRTNGSRLSGRSAPLAGMTPSGMLPANRRRPSIADAGVICKSPALQSVPQPLHRHPGSRSAAQAIRDPLSSTAGWRVPAAVMTRATHGQWHPPHPEPGRARRFSDQWVPAQNLTPVITAAEIRNPAHSINPGSPSLRSVGRDDGGEAPANHHRRRWNRDLSTSLCCIAQNAWRPCRIVTSAAVSGFLSTLHRTADETGKMSNRSLTRGIVEFLDIVGSAIAVSAATRERRPARDADLRRLGIDPARFREIERF